MNSLKTALTTLLSPLILSVGLASTVQAKEEPPASDTTKAAARSCRLTASKETRAFYPEGLLELSARECWAGPGAEIIVLGKNDIISGDRNHMMPGKSQIAQARATLLGIMPADVRSRFSSIEKAQQEAILNNIIGASFSSTNSSALKYRFEATPKLPAKDVFITVVDDIYHVHDQMAAIAGIYLGSFIADKMYMDDDTRISMRSLVYAHETGHGARNDALVTIRDNKIALEKTTLRTPLERLESETGADRDAHGKYDHAAKQGIPVLPQTPTIDKALRSLSAYYSYGVTPVDGPEDYDERYIKSFLRDPSPLPWHATSAGLSKEIPLNAAAQAEGVKIFREDMNLTLGELFYQASSGLFYELDKSLDSRELNFCSSIVESLPENLRKEEAKPPTDATSFVGSCIGHSLMARGFAINAVIALEDARYAPANAYARTYFNDFSETVRAGVLSTQFMASAALYYLHHQRQHLTDPETKNRWDSFFIKQDLLERLPAEPPPAAAPAPEAKP